MQTYGTLSLFPVDWPLQGNCCCSQTSSHQKNPRSNRSFSLETWPELKRCSKLWMWSDLIALQYALHSQLSFVLMSLCINTPDTSPFSSDSVGLTGWMDKVLLIKLVLLLITVNRCDHQPKSNPPNQLIIQQQIHSEWDHNSESLSEELLGSMIPEMWKTWTESQNPFIKMEFTV